MEDRLQWFDRIGFHPHGLYLPDDNEERIALLRRLREAGDIHDLDARIPAYLALQRESAELWVSGVPGRWRGQQAVVRSGKRFRLVAYGRRTGKTYLAANEGACAAKYRPGTHVWAAAPTMDLVGRVFDFIIQILTDSGTPISVLRNSDDEKLIVLENRSTIEGISLHTYNTPRGHSAAGAAVDLAIIDEATHISQDAWTRGVIPPLSDRNGQALLLSSWEGEDSYFYKLAKDGENKDEWEVFIEESWLSNFYMFPQGRQSPAIVQAEKEMPALDFLEQFGAVPAGARNLVYPQFKELVHVEDVPFDRDKPVIVGIDPSGGANEYAVIVAQDKGETLDFIDEFYAAGVVVEDIKPVLDKRPWRENVTDAVVDSAWPSDIQRWGSAEAGGSAWPAYPISEKPHPWERWPIYRRMLRDPLRFYRFYYEKVAVILAEWGDPRSYADLTPDEQQKVAIEVEELLSDTRLTDPDIMALKACSRIRIDRHACPNFIQEHKTYRYRPPRPGQQVQDMAVKSHDHLMDASGYLVWQFKRFDDTPLQLPENFVRTILAKRAPQELDDEFAAWLQYDTERRTPQWRAKMFFDSARSRFPRQARQHVRVKL